MVAPQGKAIPYSLTYHLFALHGRARCVLLREGNIKIGKTRRKNFLNS